ncbi:ABC transporter permease [Chitinophaga horti]|uniref:ABC transporter permease n=1 Tax=Chitinophaga horti TaxID=2920382 RepID=A0ABY6J6T9_9BACT|nr:ABC transporter permease [Chitinophaga horti]UYQ95385.1 ABC transporter permease [Chitinophaga horti]
MLKNYLKIAWRNLVKNRTYSAINIGGFAVGMAVAILIAFWIWDELSYNKHFKNYDRIGQIMLRGDGDDEVFVNVAMPATLAPELESNYSADFEQVVMNCEGVHTLNAGDNKISAKGAFMSKGAPDMLSLDMISGGRNGLSEPASILLSESLAKALFQDQSPMGKVVKIANRVPVKVSGVYKDLPQNTDFSSAKFIMPWELALAEWDWIRSNKDNWNFFSFGAYVMLKPNSTFAAAEARIKGIPLQHYPEAVDRHPEMFIHPMSRWRLYSNFENGHSVGGHIKFVKLYGVIGFFVLLLACINFMNLSTARSEKRAKEVGIRKAIGSLRVQLVNQFFAESVLVAMLALVLAILLVQLLLPWFNTVANKEMHILWSNPLFWLATLGFALFAGIIAGSYPAAYLSSFQPVKVLKGTFRAGRFATTPRKILVVVQFVISVMLVTGAITVGRQIDYAKDRPVGYNRNGLVSVQMTTPQIYQKYETIRSELLHSGAALAVCQSQGPLTDVWSGTSSVSWPGKNPDTEASIAIVGARDDYGKTVGWRVLEGSDFDPHSIPDSNRVLLNESAVAYMGLKNPVGTVIQWGGEDFEVKGVVKDMIMTSPYEDVRPSIFYILRESGNFVNLRIAPSKSTSQAMEQISAIFKKYNPAAPFEYTFVSEDYKKKFADEERIAQLTNFITALAILISCLGLFGLASFMAEKRTKEIGIRKILGAPVAHLWGLLSREFVVLVGISCILAMPIAWYVLSNWLQQFTYRISMQWWIFAAAAIGALALTLFTVSTQTIKAALSNPVNSLRRD